MSGSNLILSSYRGQFGDLLYTVSNWKQRAAELVELVMQPLMPIRHFNTLSEGRKRIYLAQD